jgi:enoyl-[acyl-carrier protein] reductase I
MGFMAGKKALIVGVASDRSIASGIAEAFAREGAEIAFTYQNEKLKSRVEKLSERLGQNTELLFPCDVTSDEEIDAVFAELGKHWDGIDIIVHSVGFAPRDQLAGGFVESITREGNPDNDLRRGHQGRTQLQRHGPCQGEPGVLRALFGR